MYLMIIAQQGHSIDIRADMVKTLLEINPYKLGDNNWMYCIENHDGVPLGWYSSVDKCLNVIRMMEEHVKNMTGFCIRPYDEAFHMPPDEEV